MKYPVEELFVTEPRQKPGTVRVYVRLYRARLGRARRRLGGVLRSARRAVPFSLGIVAALVAVALYGALQPRTHSLDQTDVNRSIASALASVTPAPPDSQRVYADVAPSLVLIQVERSPADSPGPGASPSPAKLTSTGSTAATTALGSGVIVDDAGDIMTALHVVADATAITVTFADGTVSPAQVANADATNDIAVLQASQLPGTAVPAVLGNPRSVQVGSEAFVLGNPFGLDGSLSAGVISGLNRSFQLPDGTTIAGLIQVDAAVNPGSSGGPLVNSAGQVVGIVTALINPTDQGVFIGIGLAVPIDVATSGGLGQLPQY